MRITNFINTARRYFEIKTAFNIDRLYFQSLVSTAHKLLIIHRALVSNEEKKGLELAESISAHWFEKLLTSSLFAEYHDLFKSVRILVATEGVSFDYSPQSQAYDEYCQYILIVPPTSNQPLIMNLTTGETGAPDYTRNELNATACGILKIGNSRLPIYDFTRREYGPSVSIVSGYWPMV